MGTEDADSRDVSKGFGVEDVDSRNDEEFDAEDADSCAVDVDSLNGEWFGAEDADSRDVGEGFDAEDADSADVSGGFNADDVNSRDVGEGLGVEDVDSRNGERFDAEDADSPNFGEGYGADSRDVCEGFDAEDVGCRDVGVEDAFFREDEKISGVEHIGCNDDDEGSGNEPDTSSENNEKSGAKEVSSRDDEGFVTNSADSRDGNGKFVEFDCRFGIVDDLQLEVWETDSDDNTNDLVAIEGPIADDSGENGKRSQSEASVSDPPLQSASYSVHGPLHPFLDKIGIHTRETASVDN